jgi:hypothetical protein
MFRVWQVVLGTWVWNLGMFENRVRRRTFGRKREEVTREWRKIQSKELHELYCSLNAIRPINLRRIMGQCM